MYTDVGLYPGGGGTKLYGGGIFSWLVVNAYALRVSCTFALGSVLSCSVRCSWCAFNPERR